MGLMLSVLIGCVGVLELLACLRHVSDSVIITINQPATPCLSYHEQTNDNASTHDSICSYSHSTEARMTRGAKQKLENLHEYSLRIRSQLRSRDKNFDYGTLSECSLPRDYFHGSRASPDSRLSPDFEYLVQASEIELEDDEKRVDVETFYGDAIENQRTDKNVDYSLPGDYFQDSQASPDSRLSPDFEHLAQARPQIEIENDEKRLDASYEEAIENQRTDKNVDYSLPGDYFQDSQASPDPRLSPDFEHLVQARPQIELKDDDKRLDGETSYEDAIENQRTENSSRDRPLSVATPEPDKYVRVPTPIPFDAEEDYSSLGVSSDVGTSFDNDSGNEAPTMRSINRYESPSDAGSSRDESDDREILKRRPFRKSHSRSPDPMRCLRSIQAKTEAPRGSSQRKKGGKSSSTIVRKPTRLKSKNAEVSKSAESLLARKSKRHREPERRKSDIASTASFRDEWTNTSPLGSPALSRSESRKSVSVQVQTSFEEILAGLESENSVVGLSESKRDLSSRDRYGRRSFFKNRRFGGSTSRDKVDDESRDQSVINATASVEETKDTARLLKISSFEEAEVEDYERIRSILATDSDSKDEEKRRKGSRSVSSFEDDLDYWDAEDLIFSGEYTKAMNKDWHSGHFCCWQCDESLTGQRYVLRDEHPYCIKCYESVFANGCEECNKIIGIDSKDLSYKDKHWHEACFLCNRCRVSLVDKQFGSKVDKIYCGNCYDAQFASRCDGCGEIFRAGTKKMEYKTRQWHEKCFCCVVCKNPIGTKSFIPREQEIYCAGCYEDKFATRCVKCNKIITSGGVTYKNEPWHRDCFTCSNCNNSLAGQRFTSRDDKPYCADCFGELFAKRCTACSKPITGIGGTRFISFEDRHWHNDCFICAGCKTSLVGRGFITDNEDIICPECAKMKLM
ncbi:four and a half LIM domains protein limpet isoform X4 [Colletes latitarsis]|uniref:four and a half LIM domains protein limpet isoform X4 n=1 Tax=Colletes latitarsis TaxID=2605962 RepID=UPI004036DD90